MKRYILGLTAVLFVAFIFMAYIVGYKETIPTYKMFMHVFIGFGYLAGMYVLPMVRNMQLRFLGIFLYNLTFALTLRYLFLCYTGDPYEDTHPCDTYSYEGFAVRGLDRDFFEYVKYILSEYNVDDLGYFSYMEAFVKLFRDIDFVRWLLLVVNSIFVTYSAYKIYRLCGMLGQDERTAFFAGAIYGLFPFWIVSSVMGLKENVFCFFIVFALYYIYMYKVSHRVKDFVWAVLFIALTYLFRSAVCLILCITFVVLLYCNEKNRKTFLWLSVIGSMVGILLLNYIVENFTHTSMDSVYSVTEHRMGHSVGTGLMGWIIQTFATFVGPFPNFFPQKVQYGIYHSSGILFKCILGAFANFSLLKIVKDYDWRYYPLVLYLLMGYVMLLLSGVSLDLRYHITFFVAFVILAARALEGGELKKNLVNLYTCGVCLLVFYYNMR